MRSTGGSSQDHSRQTPKLAALLAARIALTTSTDRVRQMAPGTKPMLTPQQWILLGALLAPMLALVAIVWTWRWACGFRKDRAPVSERLLRPAGESLRTELEKIDERLNETLMGTFFGPAYVTAFLLVSKPAVKPNGSLIVPVMILTLGAAWFGYQVWQTVRLIQKRRNFRLGFAGERAVAEELNRLMLDGCRIFHDVPMAPYGNVDHVVVAPSGIYAVETKARRKRKVPPGKKDHEVIFDGKTLLFPDCADSRCIEQTRRQTDRLRVFLSNAVGESVAVRGILTFPGWFVTCRAKAEIKVLNPKGIRSAILDERLPKLATQLRDRVNHQLDQKCRDVEF